MYSIPNTKFSVSVCLFLEELQSSLKYLEKSKEIKTNWAGVKNFHNCFSLMF